MVSICVNILQVEMDENEGRKGRGRGAKQASTHTLLQVSQDPRIHPSIHAATESKQLSLQHVSYVEAFRMFPSTAHNLCDASGHCNVCDRLDAGICTASSYTG